jgi:alkylated DNA nucleotide flippase Atl1
VRAHEVDLITLIQGTKQFQVPLYQRVYSWGHRQLEQLWSDITDEVERLAQPASTGHFLGSVVLAPTPALHAGGLQSWLVVDGQQRLTTLMLALAALRDHVAEEHPTWAERLQDDYLVNRYQQADGRLRVLPTQHDRDAFRACVLGQAATVGDSRIGKAYRLFRSWLIEAERDGDRDLDRVEQVIRTRLRLVEITAEQGDNVHRIFQSLNNTGLSLTQADLLRNFLFMLMPTRAEDVYRDTWLPMQQQLGDDGLETLMWLDLVLRGDDKAKQSDLYRAQATRLEAGGTDERVIVAEVAELARRSRHLKAILDPGQEQDETLRAQLRRINEWGGQTAYPVAMLLLDHRERGATSSADAAEALRLVEGFLVRRMLAGVPTNNLNRIFNGAPRELAGSTDLVTDLHRYLSGSRRYWPTDAQLRQAIHTKPFYYAGRGPQKTFVLRRIEESYRSREPVDWNRADLTIEHVMPQTLSEEWVAALQQDAANDSVTVRELHSTLVHTLGNLTLSGRNVELSNHPFTRKQEILSSSALAMNQEIAAAPAWGRKEISERADRLADLAVSIWPAPVDVTDEEDPTRRDWSLLHRALTLLPAGSWTTYGDLAELIGSHPVAVGQHLAKERVDNAWRVLTSDGTPSSQFAWLDAGRTETQQEVLESEGVQFAANGRASADQRLSADDLAELLGLEVPDVPDEADPVDELLAARADNDIDLLGSE